jgi:hypothetical protein
MLRARLRTEELYVVWLAISDSFANYYMRRMIAAALCLHAPFAQQSSAGSARTRPWNSSICESEASLGIRVSRDAKMA